MGVWQGTRHHCAISQWQFHRPQIQLRPLQTGQPDKIHGRAHFQRDRGNILSLLGVEKNAFCQSLWNQNYPLWGGRNVVIGSVLEDSFFF